MDDRHPYRTETVDGKPKYIALDKEGNPLRVGMTYVDGNGDPCVIVDIYDDGSPDFPDGPIAVMGNCVLGEFPQKIAWGVLTPMDSPNFSKVWRDGWRRSRLTFNQSHYFNCMNAWNAGRQSASKPDEKNPYHEDFMLASRTRSSP